MAVPMRSVYSSTGSDGSGGTTDTATDTTADTTTDTTTDTTGESSVSQRPRHASGVRQHRGSNSTPQLHRAAARRYSSKSRRKSGRRAVADGRGVGDG
jgi:hypothetical protein